jgi:hypothetical protein
LKFLFILFIFVEVKEVKYTVCDICGVSVKARGIGGHKALVHGVVERVVVRGVDNRVQRPGDYVKKKSKVVEVRRESALKLASEGRKICSGCSEYIELDDLMDGLCWGCRPENQ